MIIPRSLVSSSHTVLFITKPSTKAELECFKTFTTEIYPSLFKNEAGIDQVGQVQFVKEAAGKLRVFAMVDV